MATTTTKYQSKLFVLDLLVDYTLYFLSDNSLFMSDEDPIFSNLFVPLQVGFNIVLLYEHIFAFRIIVSLKWMR